jgi:hypothetical protein
MRLMGESLLASQTGFEKEGEQCPGCATPRDGRAMQGSETRNALGPKR